VPALTTLATAATARKRRRVGSRGGNIMGWSIADVFVVISAVDFDMVYLLSGFSSLEARQRSGAALLHSLDASKFLGLRLRACSDFVAQRQFPGS
jgi:hypothetical protein